MDTTHFMEALRQALPATFSRQVAAEHLKGIYSAAGLANLDCAGKGPGGIRLGRIVAYEKESFLAWLEGRMQASSTRIAPRKREA